DRGAGAMRFEEASENKVRNPRARGTVTAIGPPTWNEFHNGTVTADYTVGDDGEGGQYVDAHITNPGATQGQFNIHFIHPSTGGGRPAAAQGQVWSASLEVAHIAGTLPATGTLVLAIGEFNGSGTFVGSGTPQLNIKPSLTS